MPQLTKAREAERLRERDDARAYLREIIPKGSPIYVNITHTSRSNMSWKATVSIIRNGTLVRVTREVAKAIEWDLKKGELVGGSFGMDRAAEIAYCLSKALYDEGYEVQPRYV